MSLKNYLNKYFNEDYFKLLLKRHLGLALIPMAVFCCILFLFAILDIDIEGLIILLIPYAVAIVPLTALILFKSYTKKGDSAYLLSIPLTRPQLFITTYFVGLVMIEVTLFIMTTITFLGYRSELIEGIITFISLGGIYYTFACLGCMMGNQTISQFLNMGVICFGPLALYLLSKLSMLSLSFGSYTTPIDDSLVMLICPLMSAAEFLSNGSWPYWWAHILLIIGTFMLCIYLIQRRPIEQVGGGEMFEMVKQWITKPVIYLNIVYLVFNICLYATLNQSHYYDKHYYFSVLLLLVGVSILVGLLISIWTSKNVKHLFQPKEILYQIIMILVACGFMFVPLWQNEQARIKSLENVVPVRVNVPLGYNDSWVTLPKEDVQDYLEKINAERSTFISSNDYYMHQEFDRASEICIDHSQNYYFNIDEASNDTIQFMETVYKKQREDLDVFSELYYYKHYGASEAPKALIVCDAVYDVEEIESAIESTYEDELIVDFLEELIVPQNFYQELNDLGLDYSEWHDVVGDYYSMTFSSMDYFSWLEYVMNHIDPIISQEEWKNVANCLQIENGTITSNYLEEVLKHVEVLSIDHADYWSIESVTENQVVAQTIMYVNVLEDFELSELALFEDTEIGLTLRFVVDKIDGKWQPTFTGVYY